MPLPMIVTWPPPVIPAKLCKAGDEGAMRRLNTAGPETMRCYNNAAGGRRQRHAPAFSARSPPFRAGGPERRYGAGGEEWQLRRCI
jgi:hypothetical protein